MKPPSEKALSAEAAKTVNRSDKAGKFIEQTISLGCVIVPSRTNLDENTVEEIKSQADQALYASKAAGKSRFTITHYVCSLFLLDLFPQPNPQQDQVSQNDDAIQKQHRPKPSPGAAITISHHASITSLQLF